MLRRAFAIAQRLSPNLAAGLAFRLFLRSFRHPLRPEDAARLARTRRQRIEAGDDSIEVHEWESDGPTAIVIHGWGSSAARFTQLAEGLHAAGWRVLVFDAPGHGASSGRSSSLPQFIAALDAVIAHCGPPQALLGHSLGALAIACRHAEGPPAWSGELRAVVLISMPSGAAFLVHAFVHMLGLSAATEQRLRERFRARFSAPPEHYAALPGAARITAPVLLVHDRADDLIPYGHSAALLSQLPHARLVTTEGQGHSALTREDSTIAAIVEFARNASG